jgi:hypothetical protein
MISVHLREQLHTRPAEHRVAQLVADQHIGPISLRRHAVQPVLVLAFLQLRHQPDGSEEAYGFASVARSLPQCRGQVRFPDLALQNRRHKS